MTDQPTPDDIKRYKLIRIVVDAIKADPKIVDHMDDIVELALTESNLEHLENRIVSEIEIPDDTADLEDE